MPGAVSSIFGGTDTSAQEATAAQNVRSQDFIEKSAEQARLDVVNLFPRGDVARNIGFQQALDVFGKSIPEQLRTFRSGNVGAQRTLLRGLPQIQNAILGGPVNLGALRPTEIGFDSRFSQQTLDPFFNRDPNTEFTLPEIGLTEAEIRKLVEDLLAGQQGQGALIEEGGNNPFGPEGLTDAANFASGGFGEGAFGFGGGGGFTGPGGFGVG